MNYKNPDGSNRKARDIRELKRFEAEARASEHASRSNEDQVKLLDSRGFAAKRERAKLMKGS